MDLVGGSNPCHVGQGIFAVDSTRRRRPACYTASESLSEPHFSRRSPSVFVANGCRALTLCKLPTVSHPESSMDSALVPGISGHLSRPLKLAAVVTVLGRGDSIAWYGTHPLPPQSRRGEPGRPWFCPPTVPAVSICWSPWDPTDRCPHRESLGFGTSCPSPSAGLVVGSVISLAALSSSSPSRTLSRPSNPAP